MIKVKPTFGYYSNSSEALGNYMFTVFKYISVSNLINPHQFNIFSGVLMWEIFTCGKMPYGKLKNTEVVERVQRGILLERPKAATSDVYHVKYILSSYKMIIDYSIIIMYSYFCSNEWI